MRIARRRPPADRAAPRAISGAPHSSKRSFGPRAVRPRLARPGGPGRIRLIRDDGSGHHLELCVGPPPRQDILPGGGDEFLGVNRKRLEQGGPAMGIQLAKHIVDQQHGFAARGAGEDRGLGEPGRQNHGPLLAFGRKPGRGMPVDQQFQVVPVRPHQGLAGLPLRFTGCAQRIGQRGRMRGNEGKRERRGAGDPSVGFSCIRPELLKNLSAECSHPRTVFEERTIERGQLVRRRAGQAKQPVAGTQGMGVAPQGIPVSGRHLQRQLIHERAPGFRPAAHQLDVAVGKPHRPAHFEITGCRPLLDRIHRELAPLGAVVELQVKRPEPSVHHQPARAPTQHIREAAGPGRLQPQQDGDRFEKRRFSLRIGTAEQVGSRMKGDLRPLDAPHVPHDQAGEMRGKTPGRRG